MMYELAMLTAQTELFASRVTSETYTPRPAPLFRPRQIILAKGGLNTPERRCLVDGICAAYPSAKVIEQLSVPHNKVSFDCTDPLERHYRGHRALVLGEHKSAVGRSDEVGNTCPNFWHFSPYGYCPYGCQYCYLAGTQGVRFAVDFLNGWEHKDKSTAYYDWMVREFFRVLDRKGKSGFSWVTVPGTNETIYLGTEWASRAESARDRAEKAVENDTSTSRSCGRLSLTR